MRASEGMEQGLAELRLARRATGLSTAFSGSHFPSELDAEVIPFDSGFAAPDLLPDLTSYAIAALDAHRAETLQYAAGRGQPHLRGWIADLMNRDGCDLTPDHIMIVNGAKNGLDLVARLLLDEGDAIVVTAPMYFTAIPIFRNFGIEFIEIEQDEAGIDIAALEAVLEQRAANGLAPPKLIYNVADFHNPSGVTMTVERRRALVALGSRAGIAVLEDTPYRKVRFEGETVPSLKSLDRDGTVIHVGTFSKLVAPGLRMGWVAAEPELIARLVQLKAEGGSSPLIQRILYEFGRSPAFDEHVERVRASYRERRDRMVAALARYLPEARIALPEGGYYLWLTLPPHVDGDALARAAGEAGIHLIAGSRFFAGATTGNRPPPRNHVRLSYSFASPDAIDAGIARLARVYRALVAR